MNPSKLFRINYLFLLVPLLFLASGSSGQPIHYTTQNAHSHNDYEQEIPFWMAYDQGFGSIEADLMLSGGQLIVAHDSTELTFNRPFKTLYLENIQSCIKKNAGYPYRDSSRTLQLLIDIKTDSIETLSTLIALLEHYPDIIHNPHIFLVITGRRPDPELYSRYPDFIWFDGTLSRPYSNDQLSKIKMLSEDFQDYSQWKGEDTFPARDFDQIKAQIIKAHKHGIRVRFWAAPDFPNAWKELIQLQVDFINTDHIAGLTAFLQIAANASYRSGSVK